MVWVSRPVEERLRERLAPVGDCLVWTGTQDKDGYGKIRIGSRTDGSRRIGRTHVVALTLALGRPLAPGMQALHTCDNPPCCRSEHLYEGTPVDNSADAVARKRHAKARMTHCQYGHEFTPENTKVRANGTRACRVCSRRRKRESWHRAPR